jgi:cell wall-associated NlpC family hydrolase
MRKLVTLGRLLGATIGVAATLVVAAGAGAAVTAGNWDLKAQRLVVRAGLMTDVSAGQFGGALALSASSASSALAGLASTIDASPAWSLSTQLTPVQAPVQTVTVAGFDALMVDQLGLAGVAAHIQQATAAAGLTPPSYFGTEVVARFLGLRYTQPVGSEQLALFPTDPITRAEAAWSLAQILADGSSSVPYATTTLSSFALPALSAPEVTALTIAVSKIGFPYIWGGTTDDTSDGLPHGGFDCSGFVWRVYKVSGLQWGAQILGRTAAQMAGEIPKSARLRMRQLGPGDILFFGTAHFGGVATEKSIIHAGIYLGDNWVIHSSDQGVYVDPLKGGWLGQQFAWGRRVLPSA